MNNNKFSLYKVIKSLSYSMDLISTTIVGHHKKVAYISLELANEMNLNNKEKKEIVMAAMIHDLGVFYLNQNYSDLKFDNKNNKHAEIGYSLLKNNFPVDNISKAILYHHHEWKNNNEKVPLHSHVLHLADRIASLVRDDNNILSQAKKIEKKKKKNKQKRS